MSLVFLDSWTVSGSDETARSFPANGDLGTSIDGATQHTYFIEGLWVPPASAGSELLLRPNNILADQHSEGARTDGTHNLTETSLVLARTISASDVAIYYKAWFLALTTTYKILQSEQTVVKTVGPEDTEGSYFVGVWNDTATQVTSLAIVAEAASGIKIGSFCRLFAVPTP